MDNTKNMIKRKSNLSFHDKMRPYLYLSPAVISIFILTFLPIVYTVYISFTNYSINHLYDAQFVGLKNFKTILTGPLKPIFLPVFAWTVVFAIISTFGSFLIEIGRAHV